MKKALLILFLIMTLTLVLGLVSCGGGDSCEHVDADDNSLCDKCGEKFSDGDEAHVHSYTVMNVADKYLATEANCKNAATYFYSCSCGEAGNVTFESGNPIAHTYTEQNTDVKYLASAADCENAAKYYYSCSCGEKGEESFSVGYSNGHSFTDGVCTECASEGTPGLVYSLSDNEYTVVGTKTGDEMLIVIPSTYNGKPVVAVADGAFSDCKNLLSVEIGKNVTEISLEAFEGCDKLTELIYRAENYSGPTPETVMEIHNLKTKIRRAEDFWFYTKSDTISYLVHYSGKSSAVTLPEEYFVDETVRILLPTVITASDFENTILLPLVEKLSALLEKYCRADNPTANFNFIGNDEYEAYEYGCINSKEFRSYMQKMQSIYRSTRSMSSDERKEINVLYNDIMKLFAVYSVKNPQKYLNADAENQNRYEEMLQLMYEQYPITKSGLAIYVYASSDLPAAKDSLSAIITKHFSKYNYQTLIEQERRAGVVYYGDYTVDSRFFIGSIATDITVPSDKSDLSINSLSECDQLIKIHLKKGAQWDPTRISEAKHFSSAKCVIEFTVESDHEDYISIDGNLYSKDGKTLIQYAIGKTNESFSIPAGVNTIGDFSFFGCESLATVTIPDSITSIGAGAFSGCSNLTGAYISDIGSWCGITFGDRYYSSNSLFENGVSLYLNGNLVTHVIVPNDVTFIGARVFSGYSKLKSVTIPGSVTSIGFAAFSGCENLTDLTIENGVISIESSAFEGCAGITSVMIPESVKSVGDGAFYNCLNLASVNITNIEAWCEITFENVYANPLSMGAVLYINGELLTEIVIPDSVTSIGMCAFMNCIELDSVKFENPNGWFCSQVFGATSGTVISSTDLQDYSTAATYLTSTYCYYYWQRA